MSNEITHQLKKAFLFRDLPEEMLATLSDSVHSRHLQKSDVLFRKGDPGDSLFMIGKGRLKVVTEDTGGVEIILNQIEAGDMVGEVSLFDQAPRSASVIALEDSDVLELKREDFLQLIDQNPEVALSMMRDMSARMRFNAVFIQKVTEWSKKIAEGDFSFAEQTQSRETLTGASDDDRANKFLSEFFTMARKLKEQAKKPPHFDQMQAIEPDLRNLLPAELYAELYVADWADQDPNNGPEMASKEDGKKLKPAFDHLAALQKILSDYTSSLITEKRDESSKKHIIKRNGALMFTDLAGFTKLMEANADKGKEGAENLLKVLNGYFTDIIEVISISGGELLEFTGDALLVLFPTPLSENQEANNAELRKAISKAIRAGLRMQKVMESKYKNIPKLGSEETLTLQMRIGIHAGHFYSSDIGTPRRREHVLLGKNVQRAKMTEGYGENGRVNLTPEAYEYVKGNFEFNQNKEHEGFMLVVDHLEERDGYEIMAKSATRRLASTMLLDKSFNNTYDQIKNLLNAIKEFSSFIPTPVLNLLVESAARRKIPAEFPTPTIMFVNFIGLPEMIDKGIYEEDSIIASFNQMFARLGAAVEKRGGVLKKVTYHLTGSDIVIYFGVPTAHSNDPMRAASAAIDIRDIIMKTKVPALKPGCEDPEPDNKNKIYCQIGINTGPTFVAEIGDPRGRREFNVLGDTVNTTARLMSKAKMNEIYVSEAVMEQIEEKYECLLQEPMKLKGKSKEIKVYELKSRKPKSDS
jgi:class 3 adenylate cyclase/CRP-like cAMP-binding protein